MASHETNTGALRATGQTVTPAVASIGKKSVIFSHQSDALFDAITQRYDNKYHLTWNSYD